MTILALPAWLAETKGCWSSVVDLKIGDDEHCGHATARTNDGIVERAILWMNVAIATIIVAVVNGGEGKTAAPASVHPEVGNVIEF